VAARPFVKAKGLQERAPRAVSYSAPGEDGEVQRSGSTATDQTGDPYANVGRNAPCPCGSGKKFKMCHGRSGAR
jgi:preprotein translocase subunit SecA